MEKLIIEFEENGIARCEKEDGSFIDVEACFLPDGAKSGDILHFDGEKYVVATQDTDRKKQDMLSLQARLFGKKK